MLSNNLVIQWLKGWKKINNNNLPQWVSSAYNNWRNIITSHPYNKTKYFIGKTFVYKVIHGRGLQGEAPVIGWYKKLKYN